MTAGGGERGRRKGGDGACRDFVHPLNLSALTSGPTGRARLIEMALAYCQKDAGGSKHLPSLPPSLFLSEEKHLEVLASAGSLNSVIHWTAVPFPRPLTTLPLQQ